MMTAELNATPLKEVVRFHYGAALRTDQRDGRGDVVVYGSNGPVGRHNEAIVSHSTLIIGRKGSVGSVHYAPDGGWPIDTTYYTEIIDESELDLRYLYYALKQSRLERHTIVTSIPGLNRNSLEQTKIPLPPLSEQRRIADILDKADAIRRKRREAVEAFDLLVPAVFSEMFSSDIATGEWSPLSESLVELRYGTSNKSGAKGYPTLRIPNIVRGVVDVEDLKTVAVTESEFDKLQLSLGDMLFVRTNGNPDYVGRCAVFDPEVIAAAGLEPERFIYASYLIRARLDTDQLRPTFLQAYLQTPGGRRLVRDRCRTSAGQYNINTKGISSLPVPIVDLWRQRTFEERLDEINARRKKLVDASDLAAVGFDSLVQRAFRGEL